MSVAAEITVNVADAKPVREALRRAERHIRAGDALADEVALHVEHGESGRSDLLRALARYRKTRRG